MPEFLPDDASIARTVHSFSIPFFFNIDLTRPVSIVLGPTSTNVLAPALYIFSISSTK